MAKCNEMKKGECYKCGDCGLEVEVLNECNCDGDKCKLECCGKPLVKREE